MLTTNRVLSGRVRLLVNKVGLPGASTILGTGTVVIRRVLACEPVAESTLHSISVKIEDYEQKMRNLEDVRRGNAPPSSRGTGVRPSAAPPPLKTRLSKLDATERFRVEVWNKSKEVDAFGDLDWIAFARGFFLGVGFTLDEAMDLASLVLDRDFLDRE